MKYPEIPKPPKKMCFRCDPRGHTMITVWSYKISGDPDKLLGWMCPQCSFWADEGKKYKGILTL